MDTNGARTHSRSGPMWLPKRPLTGGPGIIRNGLNAGLMAHIHVAHVRKSRKTAARKLSTRRSMAGDEHARRGVVRGEILESRASAQGRRVH
jgi:hypothetical protein